jgi:hypothetical protein
MSTNSPPKGIRPESPWPLVILLAAVVTAWFLSSSWIDSRIPDREVDYHARRGQFGDKFGAVNALFSGLAFACLVYVTFLQRRELALQREELGCIREELKFMREKLFAQPLQATKAAQDFDVVQSTSRFTPVFIPIDVTTRPRDRNFVFRNTEGKVLNVQGTLTNPPGSKFKISHSVEPVGDREQRIYINIESNDTDEIPDLVEFSISYTMEDSVHGEQRFSAKGDELPFRLDNA